MFPNGMIPTRSMYIFPNGMIWKEGPLAVFGGYHGLGRSAGEGVERQAPSPGKIVVARAPRCEISPTALLTGGVSELAPPRWADGVPGGPPLACARPSRSTQAVVNSDSLLYPVVSARDPLRQLLGGLSVRCAKIYASSRQCSYVLGLKLRQND